MSVNRITHALQDVEVEFSWKGEEFTELQFNMVTYKNFISSTQTQNGREQKTWIGDLFMYVCMYVF